MVRYIQFLGSYREMTALFYSYLVFAYTEVFNGSVSLYCNIEVFFRDHIIFFAFAIMAGLSLLVIPFYPSSEQRYNGKAGDLGVSLCPSCNTQIFRDYR